MSANEIFYFFLGAISTAIANYIIIIYHKKQKSKNKERPPLIEYDDYENMAGLRRLLITKDPYTEAHSRRVAEYSRLIAKEMGWKGKPISDLYRAAILHDIGKIGIPDSILNKKGKLTEEEYQQIKDHPIYSEKILRQYDMDTDLCDTVRAHHERWDGNGYPDGLAGSEIPIMARIIAIADAYDAMVTARSYRKNLSVEQVIKELNNGKNTQFDPDILEVFKKTLENSPKKKDYYRIKRQRKSSAFMFYVIFAAFRMLWLHDNEDIPHNATQAEEM